MMSFAKTCQAAVAAALALSGSAQAANGFVRVPDPVPTVFDVGINCAVRGSSTFLAQTSDFNFEPHRAVFWSGVAAPSSRGFKQFSVVDGANVWVLDNSGGIYRTGVDMYFRRVPGALRMIDAGNASQVWGLNSANQIFRWNGTALAQIAGSMTDISVGADGAVWGVNANGQIFRWFKPSILVAGSFVQVPGPALTGIEVGNAKAVWGRDSANNIYRHDGTAFVQVPGSLKQISVGANGTTWGVDALNRIFRWDGAAFAMVPGTFSSVTVGGSEGCVWARNPNGSLYIYRFK